MQCSSSVADHADAEAQKKSQARTPDGRRMTTLASLQGDGARTPVALVNSVFGLGPRRWGSLIARDSPGRVRHGACRPAYSRLRNSVDGTTCQ